MKKTLAYVLLSLLLFFLLLGVISLAKPFISVEGLRQYLHDNTFFDALSLQIQDWLIEYWPAMFALLLTFPMYAALRRPWEDFLKRFGKGARLPMGPPPPVKDELD